MSIALQARVSVLEARVKLLEEAVAEMSKQPEKKLCPKCGVKPAYFFHVKNCAG